MTCFYAFTRGKRRRRIHSYQFFRSLQVTYQLTKSQGTRKLGLKGQGSKKVTFQNLVELSLPTAFDGFLGPNFVCLSCPLMVMIHLVWEHFIMNDHTHFIITITSDQNKPVCFFFLSRIIGYILVSFDISLCGLLSSLKLHKGFHGA